MQQMDKTASGPEGQGPVPPEASPVTGRPPGGPGAPRGGAPVSGPAKRKPPVIAIVIALVALALGGLYGVRWVQHRQAFVSTDDAQVAGNLVNISARVPGHVAKINVDEGQVVKAGQVLATLDRTDYQAQLDQARAALAVAESNLGSSQTGVTLQSSTTNAQISQANEAVRAAVANLAAARINAGKAHDDRSRAERLYREGGLSRQNFEAATTAALAADASVTVARSQLGSAREGVNLAQAGTQQVAIKRSGVSTVQAQILQAKAMAATAQLSLDHTVITAPADGLVARRTVNAGEQVQVGQGLFSVAETQHLWVTANIEETNIRRVRDGADVEVNIDAFPKKVFHGKVSFVNAVTGAQFSVLPQNNAAGNFTKVVQRIPVKILVDDPLHELKPGMSAVVDIDSRGH